MIIVEKLAAEFEIELAAELIYALANTRRLQFNVLVVIEPDPHTQFNLSYMLELA